MEDKIFLGLAIFLCLIIFLGSVVMAKSGMNFDFTGSVINATEFIGAISCTNIFGNTTSLCDIIASSGTSYNQSLNTSDSVMFKDVNITGNLNMTTLYQTARIDTIYTNKIVIGDLTGKTFASVNGYGSFSEGVYAYASGMFSHAFGLLVNASAIGSYAFGYGNTGQFINYIPYSFQVGWNQTPMLFVGGSLSEINVSNSNGVGINTNNTPEKLSVVGNINITGFVNATTLYAINEQLKGNLTISQASKSNNNTGILIYDSSNSCKTRIYWNGTGTLITGC